MLPKKSRNWRKEKILVLGMSNQIHGQRMNQPSILVVTVQSIQEAAREARVVKARVVAREAKDEEV